MYKLRYKQRFFSKSVVFLFAMLLLSAIAGAASWPADSSGTNVGSNLPSYYEPSGIIYHSALNKLFVVSDEGMLSMMNMDGTSVATWSFNDAFGYNDFEGLAVVDQTTNYVYVLTEYPYAITQFDISTGTVVQSWSLSGIVPAPSNTRYGLEGMTYISTEGLFAVGSQENGMIYFLSVPTITTGSQPSLVRSIQPTSYVSDLFFNSETNTLYVLSGSTLTEADTQGTIKAQYSVPGSGQEGVALAPACPGTMTSIFIAQDFGASNIVPVVYKYNNYPIICTDSGGSDDSSGGTSPWPAASTGTNVGNGISSSAEPSGIVWNPESNVLFVADDNGGVIRMNLDGSSVQSWTLSGDLEGITVVDQAGTTVYVLNEYPFALYAFDTATGTKTGSWDLSSIGIPTPSSTSNGLEGVAFIPASAHSYSTTADVFAVASSENGVIYFVAVNSESAELLGSITPAAAAITDMYFAPESGILYVLYGSTATLREVSLDGIITATYTSVPGSDPEGITFVPDCSSATASVYVANDGGNYVMKYDDYPFTCTATDDGSDDTDDMPVDTDADDDGLLDTEEAVYGTNPLAVDTDSDGLTDYQEIVTYGTNALTADTDNDSLTDYDEVIVYGTSVLDSDSDDDAISDGVEVLTYGTNPLAADTDNGTVSDGQEIINGTNPLDSTDDVPKVIDPNLISSYTIDTVNALVTVYYADGHSKTINPFKGTDTIQVGLNHDSTVLIVSNGKRIRTFQNSVLKDHEYISLYPVSFTLTVTHGTSSDTVVVQFVVNGKKGQVTKTATFTLTGTNLVRV